MIELKRLFCLSTDKAESFRGPEKPAGLQICYLDGIKVGIAKNGRLKRLGSPSRVGVVMIETIRLPIAEQ